MAKLAVNHMLTKRNVTNKITVNCSHDIRDEIRIDDDSSSMSKHNLFSYNAIPLKHVIEGYFNNTSYFINETVFP